MDKSHFFLISSDVLVFGHNSCFHSAFDRRQNCYDSVTSCFFGCFGSFFRFFSVNNINRAPLLFKIWLHFALDIFLSRQMCKLTVIVLISARGLLVCFWLTRTYRRRHLPVILLDIEAQSESNQKCHDNKHDPQNA